MLYWKSTVMIDMVSCVFVSPKKLTGKFYSITSPFELRNKVTKKVDDFDLDLQGHRLT
jgi:hypothetical protein